MEHARNLDRDKLTGEETHLIAPCGIYCGACDILLGRSMGLAREMHKIVNGFNIADVGPFFLGVEQQRIVDFLDILERWGEGDRCPGCSGGGGNPACAIRTCSVEQGFLTCAECERMPCNQRAGDESPSPEAAGFLELITKRYCNWNIGNLERIREAGYRRFIDEMQEKVEDGFMTSDVISGDMVFTEAMEKATGGG